MKYVFHLPEDEPVRRGLQRLEQLHQLTLADPDSYGRARKEPRVPQQAAAPDPEAGQIRAP